MIVSQIPKVACGIHDILRVIATPTPPGHDGKLPTMLTSHGRHRYEELDSLRGLAAMVVVVGHALMLWNAPYPRWWTITMQSPLGIFFDPRDAVFLFFIMSGFVLFLPYITPEGAAPYPRYFIKRTCRIYLPYLAALAFAIGMDLLTYRPLGNIFQKLPIGWTRPFPTWAIWPHILFIFNTPFTVFNPPFWSLIHEMRISIIFPLVALLALRLALVPGLLLGFAVCCAAFFIPHSAPTYAWDTLAYTGLFLVGALIARHLPQVRAVVDRHGLLGKSFLLILMVAFNKSTHFLTGASFRDAWVVPLRSVSCALIVVLALTTVHFQRFLHTAPLRWVGKISYSLYLLHAVVMWALVSLFWLHTSHHILLLAASMALSLLVADIAYRWIERPAILLGRRLTKLSLAATSTPAIP
jgi:peptidoglycan/LPS O-acetylase OafA/YrhL